MPNVIKPKRSAVAGNIPTTSQIGQYEIAMNTADKKIFTSNGTNIIQIAAGELSGLGDVQLTSLSNGQSLSYNSATGKWVNSNAGAGDVVGPSSSTDNSVVRFDGTTGKVIQGSPVAISDTGAISGAESISNIDFAQFDTTVTVTEGVGKLQWDDGNGTLQVGLKGGNVNLQLGQEIVARVYNDSGVALTDGQIVYISGSQGNRIAVKLAKADSETTSAGTLGVVTEPIAIGAEGFITMVGTVNKLNTSGLTAGALVYLSATTAGAYTTTPPTAPNHRVTLGYVERVDNVVGSIYVKVDNGYELDELHNVVITSPTSGQTLIYDAVAGTWENASLSNGTGISVTNGAGTITIANTGVTSIAGTANQIVASAATGNITLSLPSLINVNTSGSAASLTTARTINGTSFNGTANITTNSWGTARTLTIGSSGKSVDGSTAVSWTLAEIGAQPADADLTAIAGLTGTSGFLKKTAADTWSLDTNTYYLASNPSGYTTNTGTVTSVGGTGTVSGLTLTGTVTTSGNLTLGGTLSVTPSNFASQTANTVLAAPNGTAGTPTFRALVAADIPTLNQNTTGSAATLTTGRTIGMTGDVTWTSGSFNGSANVTGTSTLASVGTAGTYTKVTTDAKGRVTSGTTLSASDIPDITLEKVPDAWVKRSVKAATTANITLSGTQTIDGVALVAGDRVLVKDQTAAAENGIYVVSATAWSRSADADTISELAGSCVNVDSGTINGGMRFDTDLKTTDALGTTAVSFYRVLDSLDLATANTANKVVLRDGSGNFSAGTITAALSGNATTATTLQTARTINGTSFNGSANITTSSWGTARTLTIGSTGKSVDGSANVSWTLAEIGAYAATNPNGYTSNTGTVTSVSGTGSYGGLTLSGTVTGSGNITLGGTPTGTWPISVSGSAASATNATNATNVTGGYAQGSYLGVQQTNGAGQGLSLYNGYTTGQPTYGIMFATTANFGTHGSVTADWATYFTMDSTANRGWVFRNTTSGNVASINNSGTAVFNGNVTAYSDETLKKDWNNLPVDFIERLSKVKSGSYTRIDSGERQVGVSAQSLRPLLPEAILEGEKLSVAYGNAAMVSAIELAKKVIEQEERIEQLEYLVNQLMQKLA